jgi:leucyl-tRNA synthetase
VTEMMSKLKMNTAVSEIMIFVNYLRTLDEIPADVWKGFIKIIAPIMPFIAEELWQTANKYGEWKNENSVHLQQWPEFDEKLLIEDSITIPVQINGKIRTEITVSTDCTEDDVKNILSTDEKYLLQIGNKTITKFLYVKDKIVSVTVA